MTDRLKTFIVSFWYATDKRAEEEVEAFTEVQALSIALNNIRLCRWVDHKPFEVRISSGEERASNG